jgi:hypothetical protein
VWLSDSAKKQSNETARIAEKIDRTERTLAGLMFYSITPSTFTTYWRESPGISCSLIRLASIR